MGWFLFISKIYQKKPFRISTLVTLLYQSSQVIKLKTNKIGVNKTFSSAMHHKLKKTLCRNTINFHLLLEGKGLNKLLRNKFFIFC